MLIGLAAKNGILIVEFANQRRDEGLPIREAILDAAATRLRPILMTSIATVTGALPLMLASGAGLGQPRRDRRGGGVRRAVVDLPVAVRGAGVLPAAGPLHARAGRAQRACWRSWTPKVASVDSSHGG